MESIIKYCIVPYLDQITDIENVCYFVTNKTNIKIRLNNICQFPTIYNIQHLKLHSCNDCNVITDNILENMPNIHILDLYYNKNITDNGLKFIPNIHTLNLYFNENITDNGLKFIPNIHNLHLCCNKNITDNGLKFIPNIHTLNLYFNENITDNGLHNLCVAKYLARHKLCSHSHTFSNEKECETEQFIPNVHTLNLGYNKNITDNGLKFIPNIHTLDLYYNKNITDNGLKFIPNIATFYAKNRRMK
jgi:hypothetical protein